MSLKTSTGKYATECRWTSACGRWANRVDCQLPQCSPGILPFAGLGALKHHSHHIWLLKDFVNSLVNPLYLAVASRKGLSSTIKSWSSAQTPQLKWQHPLWSGAELMAMENTWPSLNPTYSKSFFFLASKWQATVLTVAGRDTDIDDVVSALAHNYIIPA